MSFAQTVVHCLSWSFGSLGSLIFLYHYGLSILRGIHSFFAAWWDMVHFSPQHEFSVYIFILGSFFSIFCMLVRYPNYANTLKRSHRPFVRYTLCALFLFFYIHMAMAFPQTIVDQLLVPKTETSLPTLGLIYVFVGFFVLLLCADILWRTSDEDQPTPSTPSNDANSTNAVPTFIQLDETWEQRFARQAAERRRNSDKS